jgi:excisionase family DNA binding protein
MYLLQILQRGINLKTYTTKEAAALLGVSTQTVRKYTRLKQNPLRAARIGRRADLRIREDDLLKFTQIYGMAILPVEPNEY